MPKLTYKCPLCDKNLVLVEEIRLGASTLNRYSCGHIFSKEQVEVQIQSLDFTSADGTKQARDYQKDGIKFILESGFNCIIGDQMRLGKTPQALLALKNAYKEKTPCLILVRSANLWQWIREYKVWCDGLMNGIYPVLGTAAWIPPGFSAYIVSMDTFGSQGKCKCGHRYHELECKGRGCACRVFQSDGNSILDKLKQIPFKCVIADEAHSFKNTDSNRSQRLVDFISYLNTGESNLELKFACGRCSHEWIEHGKVTYDKRIGHKVTRKQAQCPECNNWCYISQQHKDTDKYVKDPVVMKRIEACVALSKDQSTTEHERTQASATAARLRAEHEIQDTQKAPCGLVLLTGTAIKNRAEEYFIPLNLVAPERFSSLERFRRQWLEQDAKGRWSRIKRYSLDAFKDEISPYVLRREKEDVFTDLPPLNRTFTLIEPDKELYVKAYNKLLDSMETKLAEKANPTYWDLAEDLMELRRICGMMKLTWTADYLDVSLEDSENQRFAVGLHHETVRELLYHKLGGADRAWKFSGAESIDRKNWIETHYTQIPQRVGIFNMLAGGVGCDFHEIDNVLILERQWSSADEEQFEFRFYNPDLAIKNRSTNVEYVIAKGTLDEWWFDMVESKRKIFGETIANHWSIQADNASFKALAEQTVAGRL